MKAIIQQNMNGHNFTLMLFIVLLLGIFAGKAHSQEQVKFSQRNAPTEVTPASL